MENNRDHLDDIFKRLCSEFRNVPLIALGQTVYWDEPMKAVVRSLFDQYCPNVKMLAGIHDADYFSKVLLVLKVWIAGLFFHTMTVPRAIFG